MAIPLVGAAVAAAKAIKGAFKCTVCGGGAVNILSCCEARVCDACIVKGFLQAKRGRKKYECPSCSVYVKSYVDHWGICREITALVSATEKSGR